MRIKVLVLAIVVSVLGACATKPDIYLPPSEFLLYTNRPQTEVLKGLADKLKANNYEISRFDYVTGVLSTQPRFFTFESNQGTTKGEQVLYFRQESGSLKMRMQYLCEYQGPTGLVWTRCRKSDSGAIDKIERLENMLLPLVTRDLNKYDKGNATSPGLTSQIRGNR